MKDWDNLLPPSKDKFSMSNVLSGFSPTQHTLLTTTIHITKSELEQLLIATAKNKIQDNWEFAIMRSDKFGGYKLTFTKTDEKISTYKPKTMKVDLHDLANWHRRMEKMDL